MTNGWGSIHFGGCADLKVGMKAPFKQVTLKQFKDCLPKLCSNDSSIIEAKNASFNYGLCTLGHNLYGIFSIIAKALGKDENMIIERVISEWSEGPFL